MEAALVQAFAAALAQPWHAPYRERGQVLLQALARSASVAQALNVALAAQGGFALPAGPLRFVAQADLPAGEGYEAFIGRCAAVPTRDNAHDLLNGLIWLHWPQLKARLNALHLQALAQQCDPDQRLPNQRRGPLRDALTVLDENAALLCAPAALCQALRERDWACLFGELRPLWAQSQLLLFGHALLEKLMQPRKPICAHVLLLPDLGDAAVAAAVAATVTATVGDGQSLAGKLFLPLPILGVPGWWPANELASFYADPQVFRP